jgi:hypothetical protein
MGVIAIVLLAVGAAGLGMLLQALGAAGWNYDWVFTALPAALAGCAASVLLGAPTHWGPELDGMFLVPAIVGVVTVGVSVAGSVRMLREPFP